MMMVSALPSDSREFCSDFFIVPADGGKRAKLARIRVNDGQGWIRVHPTADASDVIVF
jgi:hypothetical protein